MSDQNISTTVDIVDRKSGSKKKVRSMTVSKGQVITALETWEKKPPKIRDAWLQKETHTWAVLYKDKCYPPKLIMRLAIKEDTYTIERVYQAFQQLGFEVIRKSECDQA